MSAGIHIHSLLNILGDQDKPRFILQIGAMDGVTGDPVHDALMTYDWPALVVEPVPEHFETLQNTYDDRPLVRCAKVAVSDQTGRASMYVIPDEAADDPRYPGWAPAASSLYKTRTALHWHDIAPLVQKITVEAVTLSTLISAYDVTDIDVFQIDAEGADYMILKQLDFERFKPLVINLEIVNLPSGEQAKTRALLDKQGYIYQKTGYDLVAVREDSTHLFPSLAL